MSKLRKLLGPIRMDPIVRRQIEEEISSMEAALASAAPSPRNAPSAKGFNLNREVWVKITAVGEKLYRKFYSDLGLPCPPLRPRVDGKVRFPLWEVAHLFGPGLYNGCKVPIETEVEWDRERVP